MIIYRDFEIATSTEKGKYVGGPWSGKAVGQMKYKEHSHYCKFKLEEGRKTEIEVINQLKEIIDAAWKTYMELIDSPEFMIRKATKDWSK